jgi:putative transposase
MSDRQSTRVRETLKSLFSDQRLNALARATEFVQRQRKVKPVAFFWTLVLGFGVGSTRKISGLRRAYQRSTGTTLVPSSFYDRFNDRLVEFLKEAVEHALGEFQLAFKDLNDRFKTFKDVMITDSSVIKLHDALAKLFPGCRTNNAPASIKLHAVMSVKGRGKSTVKLTNGRVHDRRKFVIGDWVKGKLLLFDLGYYHFRLFKNIVRLGGHFLTRLKDNANPKIVRVFNGSATDEKRLVGQNLRTVLSGLRRDVLDVEVEVRAKARRYNGRRASTVELFRVVAVRDTEEWTYHCYLTSIPVEILSAEDIASTYRARWEIELVFKELKSGYRLDDVESRKKEVVEALIYAAVLTLLASRTLLRSIASRIGGELRDRITPGRWWKVFSEYAQELQLLLIRPPRQSPPLKDLLTTIEHELIDPHTKRRPLLGAALCGSQATSAQ